MEYEIYAVTSIRSPGKSNGCAIFLVRAYNDGPKWQRMYRIVCRRQSKNSAALMAVAAAAEYVRQINEKIAPDDTVVLRIRTESGYVKSGYYWMRKWKKAGWKTAKGTPVRNREYWEKLENETRCFSVTFVDPDRRTQEQLKKRADLEKMEMDTKTEKMKGDRGA